MLVFTQSTLCQLNVCGQNHGSESQDRESVFMGHNPAFRVTQLDHVMPQCATKHVFPSLSFPFNVIVIQRSLTCRRPDDPADALLPFWFSVKQDPIREE